MHLTSKPLLCYCGYIVGFEAHVLLVKVYISISLQSHSCETDITVLFMINIQQTGSVSDTFVERKMSRIIYIIWQGFGNQVYILKLIHHLPCTSHD